MSATAPWLHDNPSVVSNNSGIQSHLKLLVRLRRKPAIPPLDGVGQLLFSEKVEHRGSSLTLLLACLHLVAHPVGRAIMAHAEKVIKTIKEEGFWDGRIHNSKTHEN